MKIISKAKCNKKERFEHWIYGLCSIFDGIVIALSLGFLYLGRIIERGCFGWYVLDWDYESYEKVIFEAKSERAAQDYCLRQI